MYARYTEYLRDLMLNEQTMALLTKALSTYPLHVSEKTYDLIPTREELNKRILDHYKYREIGFETVGRFLDELEITMKEIMPYYNERFKTIEVMAEIENPFDSVDMVETFKQTTRGTASNQGSSESTNAGTSKTNQTNNAKTVDSDTPQDSLNIGAKDIDSVDYASQAGWSENLADSESEHSDTVSGTTSGSSESETIVEHEHTRRGAQGVTTFGHDMIEFRDSIIDVMNEIVTDQRLNELFMIVY